MALNWSSFFDIFRINPSSADYPYGSAKNRTVVGNGTPIALAELWNDWTGFFQGLLKEANITPNGLPDTTLVDSTGQYLTALLKSGIFGGEAFSSPITFGDDTNGKIVLTYSAAGVNVTLSKTGAGSVYIGYAVGLGFKITIQQGVAGQTIFTYDQTNKLRVYNEGDVADDQTRVESSKVVLDNTSDNGVDSTLPQMHLYRHGVQYRGGPGNTTNMRLREWGDSYLIDTADWNLLIGTSGGIFELDSSALPIDTDIPIAVSLAAVRDFTVTHQGQVYAASADFALGATYLRIVNLQIVKFNGPPSTSTINFRLLYDAQYLD